MGQSLEPSSFILPKLPQALKSALQKLYAQLSDEQQRLNVLCRICGRCCRFAEYDHQLWATSIEIAYLLEYAGPRTLTKDGVCPYLEDHQCTARGGRTLGCRIFLCEMNPAEMEQLHERYLNRIQTLAEEFKIELLYEEFISSLKRNGAP